MSAGIHLMEIYYRDGQQMKCHYCGRELNVQATPETSDYPTVDHVIPRSKGGTNHLSNLVIACRKCNQEKADR